MEILSEYYKFSESYHYEINKEFYIQCLLNNEHYFLHTIEEESFHKNIIESLHKIDLPKPFLFFKKELEDLFLLYLKSTKNLLYNEYHLASAYYTKIFRASYFGTPSSVSMLEEKILIPFWAIPNDFAHPMYMESFKRLFFPQEHCVYFNSHYSILDEEEIMDNIDILLGCFKTKTVPILLIHSEEEWKTKLSGIPSIENRLLCFKEIEELSLFLNGLFPENYENYQEMLLQNYDWVTGKFLEWEQKYAQQDYQLYPEEFTIQQQKNFQRLMNHGLKSFQFNVKLDMQRNKVEEVYDDLEMVSIHLQKIQKIKQLPREQELDIKLKLERSGTIYRIDILGHNFSVCLPGLEPLWIDQIYGFGEDLPNKKNYDLILGSENSHNQKILMPGWINVFINQAREQELSDINAKKFSVGFLFSLRGGSKLDENLSGDLYSYSNRQYIIDHKNEFIHPNFYLSSWNKDLPQLYPDIPVCSDKSDIFISMFSICLENTIQYNYFSEKILDSCFLNSVPLYRGCPNIGQYLDRRGIIFIESNLDIIHKCNHLTENDYWDRLPYLKVNKTLIEYYRNSLFNYGEIIKRYFHFMHNYYNNDQKIPSSS